MLPKIAGASCTPENWQERRSEIVALFEENVFGRRPDIPYCVQSRLTAVQDACGKTATRELYDVTVETDRGSVTMHLALVLPKGCAKAPCVLMISNHDRAAQDTGPVDMEPMKKLLAQAPDGWREATMKMFSGMEKKGYSAPSLLDIAQDDEQGYWPVRTITDSGRAAACFYAGEAQPDDAKRFPQALSALFLESGRPRTPDGWGTLGVWAFAASVMVTVLSGHERIDPDKISVAGHSRGGKTALWCAAQDPRIRGALVNNSGCTGAAVSRGKSGEVPASICAMFPHWFCPNYGKYAWREEEMPFDQHMLVAAVAPRLCYITSGSEDSWSDPDAEWRGAKEGSAAWELFGAPPLPQDPPAPGEAYRDGPIGYHRRSGGHDLTRWDWEQFLLFLDKHDG